VRLAPALVVVAVLLALAGCGGDDEDQAATTETGPPPTAEPAPTEADEAETETEAEQEPTETEPETEPGDDAPPTSPEDLPGGAGDEEPARSLAMFSGDNGRITPRTVRVPAFISIRVELSSEDGQEYGLTFEGETIRVATGLGSVSTTIDGLRPGEAVVGTPTGPGNRVRIEATAEPGP
jgi:hypothetical protein